MRIRNAALWLVLIAATRPCAAAGPNSLREGPYPVGVTTTVFVDDSRMDHFTKKPRTLVTEIWYPAADSARKMKNSVFADFIPSTSQGADLIRKELGATVEDINARYVMRSHRDAPVRAGRFPLIVFSHGNGGMRYQNTFWCDFIASHGYIVVSADHTGNALMTFLPDRMVPFQKGEMFNSATDRPKDMIFLLDRMTKWNEGGDPRFKDRLDLSKVCAAGMSFGSMTAVRVAGLEPRFKAVVAMSGAFPGTAKPTIPTLWMIGAEDRTIGAEGNAVVRSLHERHEGPSFLLELKNGGHYSFTDMFRIKPDFGDGVGNGKRRASGEPFAFTPMETTYRIVNSYSLAFLDVYLKGDRKLLPFLRKNTDPDVLIWQDRNADVK
jgi:predicted dienelactone hydrolase